MRQTTQTSQNLVIPANEDFYNGVFRYVGTDGVLRSANLMSADRFPIDPKLRNEFLSSRRILQRQQLQVGNSTVRPSAEYCRLPVQPDRLEQSRPVHVPGRLHGDRRAPFRGGLQLLQGDRRSHRPRLHFARPAAGLHQLRSEAVRVRMALGGELEVAERAARWRQSRASAFHNELGLRRPRRRAVQHRARHHQPRRAATATASPASRRRAGTPTRIS